MREEQMDKKWHDFLPEVKVPEAFCHPKTLSTLVEQAERFTGYKIKVFSHKEARPPDWLDEEETAHFLSYIKQLEKFADDKSCAEAIEKGGRISIPGKNLRLIETLNGKVTSKRAVIIFCDAGKEWGGELISQRREDRLKADTICHEIAHLLVGVKSNSLKTREEVYFNEQCAVLGGSLLKAAIGLENVSWRQFPELKKFQSPEEGQGEVYDTFSVYTPMPIGRYYETQEGLAAGRERYLSSEGIVRFDLIAEDVVKSALHMRHHLAAMTLFGGVANEIATSPQYVRRIVAEIPEIALVSILKQRCRGDEYATSLLGEWWNAVRESTGEQKGLVPENIYVGKDEYIQSLAHANSYYLHLTMGAHLAKEKRPNDPLLRIVTKGLAEMMKGKEGKPELETGIIARSHLEKKGGPILPDRKRQKGFWRLFGK